MEGGAAADFTLDQIWLRRSFDRASRTYDAAAVLQSEVRGQLLQRLDLVALTPLVVLDAGAGTGRASRALRRRYPRARVIALDCAYGMLREAARQLAWRRHFDRVCADAARLPLADGSVDLIFSNFLLHWCGIDEVFAEFRRVLAPRGFLSFTSLGPDTLRELRIAWSRADAHGHVNRFIDMHDLGDALVRAGFASPVLDVDHYTLTYADVRGVMRDIKAVGARNALVKRPRGLTGRRKFAAMQSAYEDFRSEGRLPATFEVIFGQAWAPVEPRRRAGSDAAISLDEFKRQLRRRSGA